MKGHVSELEATNQMLKDEQQALQLEFVCLQEKYKTVEAQYNELINRWLVRTQQDADAQNREMEDFQRRKQIEIRQKIDQAMKDNIVVEEPSIGMRFGGYATSTVPTKVLYSFEAHDSEISDVKWSPSGKIFATAGVDRKVKIWEVTASRMLTGANSGVMSLDYDSEPSHMLLAGSNDFACHIWNIEDQRHRHTLTGHANRVYCARFMEDSGLVVSGSNDRTLKQWDLRERACVRTMFAGSSCNTLVTIGSLVISGHFDKKIRFWDKRAGDAQSNEITLQGKVTSLCLAGETITKMIDLRKNQVVSTFT
ncbi:hypothetical protein EB796_019189 [Bugula neritina]|uniref:Autophagy-related protein 16 domain-containing protein n=1 Tax=Bugula neritina TaxID=10212 RepID=A0A7J7J905_BUGNE|nr:hypothetical protein EB796_019189 [Bugula neritina]